MNTVIFECNEWYSPGPSCGSSWLRDGSFSSYSQCQVPALRLNPPLLAQLELRDSGR